MATSQSGQQQAQVTSARASDLPIPALQGAWWKWGTGLLMCFVIYGTFFIAKGARGFVDNGEVSRIIFFHVPVAALFSVWYIAAFVYALRYLMGTPSLDLDAKSAIAMEIGLLFCILATITGSIFAYPEWNSFWNWDPRETSIVFTLLLYAGYLVFRGALSEKAEKRARLSAVYTIVGLIPCLFLVFAVPRIMPTNHPTTVLTDASSTSPSYKLVLLVAFIAFTMLFIWMFQLRYRAYQISARRQERLS